MYIVYLLRKGGLGYCRHPGSHTGYRQNLDYWYSATTGSSYDDRVHMQNLISSFVEKLLPPVCFEALVGYFRLTAATILRAQAPYYLLTFVEQDQHTGGASLSEWHRGVG